MAGMPSEGDFIVKLLTEHLRRKLSERLGLVCADILTATVDEAVDALKIDIQKHRDNVNMTDLFEIKLRHS